MNFQCDLPAEPLRVLIVNSMSPAAKFLAVKILSGEIFGNKQLIDITLTVYTNELSKAMGLKCELDKCAFACTNSVEVSFDVPSVSDADVFCFITSFKNPNLLDYDELRNDKQLDMLDLIINIANNLQGPCKEEQGYAIAQKDGKLKIKQILPEKKARKPIFIADGLVSIDILMSLSKNLPSDIFFCPTPIPAIAKSVLGEHLKVQCKVLNDVLVWAANDEIFDVAFEKPLIIHDKVGAASPCDWQTVGKDLLDSMNLDHTQFNSTWLKKDLIAKQKKDTGLTSTSINNVLKLVVVMTGIIPDKQLERAAKIEFLHSTNNTKPIHNDPTTHDTLAVGQRNPYGSIFKAASIAKALQQIWLARLSNEKIYTNMGVVSDGYLESIKGCPYVLPVVLSGDSWTVNRHFEENVHLKQEIKRINKAVKECHEKLIPFCKKLLIECGSSLVSVEEEESQQQIALQ